MKSVFTFAAIFLLLGSFSFADTVECPDDRRRSPLGMFSIPVEFEDVNNTTPEAVRERAEVAACRQERESFNNPQHRDDIAGGLLSILNNGSFGPAGSWVLEVTGDEAMIVYRGPDQDSDLNVDELENRARSLAMNIVPGGLRRTYSTEDRSGWGWDIREIGHTPERVRDNRSETGVYRRVYGAPKLRRGLGIALVYRN